MAVYTDIHMLNQLQVTQMPEVRNTGSLPCLDPRLAVDVDGRIPYVIPTVQENQYSRPRSAPPSPPGLDSIKFELFYHVELKINFHHKDIIVVLYFFLESKKLM